MWAPGSLESTSETDVAGGQVQALRRCWRDVAVDSRPLRDRLAAAVVCKRGHSGPTHILYLAL